MSENLRPHIGALLFTGFIFALVAAGPSSAAVKSDVIHPQATSNSPSLIPFTRPSELPQDPNSQGRARVVFADRALSGWRTEYAKDNLQLYAPNSLALTRVGGVGSGSAGTCATSGGAVSTPANGKCVNLLSGDYVDAAVAESCSPGCSMMNGAYNSGGSYAIVYNNLAGGTAIANENIGSHEMGHQLGMNHHQSQESANNRWYSGVLGQWSQQMREYFDCTDQTGYGTASVTCSLDEAAYSYPNNSVLNYGGKYHTSVDRHVLNGPEKSVISAAWGYSSLP